MPELKVIAAALAAAAMLALGAAPATAQVHKVTPPAGDWTHAATGTHFPAALPPYARGDINEFTDDGLDASVSYRLIQNNGRFLVTLYVYPAVAGEACQSRFEVIKQSMTDSTPSAKLVSEGRADSPSGKARGAAYRVHYRVPAGGLAPGVEEVFSDAYLFCTRDGKWLVSYRATWSASVDFSADAERVLHTIAWPAPLGE